MTDPIVIDWAVLATKVVETAVLGGGAAVLTAKIMRRRQSAQAAQHVQPVPTVQQASGRCSSHPYMEIGQLNIRRQLSYHKTLLIQICTHINCPIPPEPPEIAVQPVAEHRQPAE